MTGPVDLWLDLKSPYSFVAKDPAYALEKEFGVTLRLRPFHLDIMSGVDRNDPAALQRGMRKIRYLYADVRRFARVQRSVPGYLKIVYLSGEDRELGNLDVVGYLRDYGADKRLSELAEQLGLPDKIGRAHV